MKKLICLVLLCLIPLNMMASCAKDDEIGTGNNVNVNETEKKERVKTKVTNVYRSNDVTLPEGYEVPFTEAIEYADGEFTFRARYNNHTYEMADFALTTEGEVRQVENAASGTVEPIQQDYYVSRQWVMEDGTTLFTEYPNAENVYSMYFSARKANGDRLFSVDIAGYLGYDLSWDADPARIGFRVMDCVTAEGIYIVLTSEGLCAISGSGSMVWKETSQSKPTAIANTEVGVLYLSATGGLRPVNIRDGKLGDAVVMPEGIIWDTGCEIYIGSGHDFYVSDPMYLWGVDYILKEDGTYTMESTEIISWQNSDLVQSEISQLCIADPETILVNMSNYDNPEKVLNYKLSLLTKVPDDEVVAEEIINLAKMDEYYNLAYAVQKFNKASETHRIVVTDYSYYEDDEQKQQKLNAEMAAGRVPDIIVFGPDLDSDKMLQTYVNSGIFADIIPYLQADETFRYDDLLGYVTQPYMTHEGEMYYFNLSPSTSIYISPKGLLDGPITPDEMFELLETLPEGTYLTTNDKSYAKLMLNNAIDSFVDWDNYTCSFDDGTFAEMIDRVKAIPDQKERPFTEEGEREAAIAEGKLYLINYSANLIEWLDTKYYYGDNATPVGIPNNEGKLITGSMYSNSYLAVTDGSAYKAEAVDFLECLMYSGYENPCYYESDVDKIYEEYKDKTFVYNKGKESIAWDQYADEAQGDKMKITEELVAEFKAILNDIDDRVHDDTMVYEIAYEEIWNGDPSRTGEEIADIVQSRVSIYLAEISK